MINRLNFKVQECHGCEGSAFQINDIGLLRPCPYCNANRKLFANKYGTDVETTLEMFVDAEKKVHKRLTKQDKERGFILDKNRNKIFLNN